jgi:CHAT domain-containing protein
LYFTPFAALSLDDGTPLLEICAVALAPSAAVLEWGRSRRASPDTHSFLVAGAGTAGGFSFADQAKAVAQTLGVPCLCKPTAPAMLQAIQEAGPLRGLHLECHGKVERGVPGVLSAARLEFAGDTEEVKDLTARQIFDLRGGLRADLVFLNACMSGGFPLRVGSEVGGFWEAFLHAGAASLIATLVPVHPDAATQLAQGFYRRWPTGGLTKAAALREAQLELRQRDPDPSRWATHILIGDHR